MKNILAFISISTVAACTTPKVVHPDFEKPRVIERMGNVSESPTWSIGSEPFAQENGHVILTNTMTMSGDSRVEVCTGAASELGRVSILRQIMDQMTSSGQLSEESSSEDPAVESLTAYLAQGRISGVKVVKRYWEKREESDASGMRVLRVHCATQVSIARSELERQIRDAMSGRKSGNPEIRERLLNAQKNFIDSLPAAPESSKGE